MVSRGIHRFRRFAFDQTVNFTTNISGQLFGCIFANGISSINYGVGSVSMPSVTEFTTLFDQYKLMSYTVEFRPRFTSVDLAGPYLPTIYFVHDTDSYTAPGTMSELMERRNVRAIRLSKTAYMTVKFPCVQNMVYQSAVSTSYGPRRGPWLDMTNYGVPHAGILWAIQGGTEASYKFDVRVRWNFLCKNQR